MTFALGQTVELTFTTTPAEFGTFTVTRPDGTTGTANVTGSAGSQVALVDADAVGLWSYLWDSPNAGQRPGTFTVGPEVITLADAKRFAPQAPTQPLAEYEADLSGLVSAVTEHLRRQYGAPLPGTRTMTVRTTGAVILPLGATVVSVNNGTTPLTAWDYDADAGLLYGLGWGYGTTTVTYTMPVLPDVREAVLLTVQHAWESRWGANPVPFQSGIDESYTASRGFFVPNRAKELLKPYGTWVA